MKPTPALTTVEQSPAPTADVPAAATAGVPPKPAPRSIPTSTPPSSSVQTAHDARDYSRGPLKSMRAPFDPRPKFRILYNIIILRSLRPAAAPRRRRPPRCCCSIRRGAGLAGNGHRRLRPSNPGSGFSSFTFLIRGCSTSTPSRILGPSRFVVTIAQASGARGMAWRSCSVPYKPL